MCVSYPARVVGVHADGTAEVERDGRRHRAVLALLDEVDDSVRVGDWLLVQSGIALARLDPAEALQRREMVDTVMLGSTPSGERT